MKLFATHKLYGSLMGKLTQVAFQLDAATVSEVDALATEAAVSRASVLRTAVAELLARRREAAIDAELERGYEKHPPGEEQVAWAEVSREGLTAAHLDW